MARVSDFNEWRCCWPDEFDGRNVLKCIFMQSLQALEAYFLDHFGKSPVYKFVSFQDWHWS